MVCWQILLIVFSPDISYDQQINNHLISIVKTRAEQISDYFKERDRDISVLAQSKEVKELLKSGLTSDHDVAETSSRERLSVISKQVEIFLNKYPEKTLNDLKEDEEFINFVVTKVGKSGSTYLLDSVTGAILINDNERIKQNPNIAEAKYKEIVVETTVVTKDQISLSVGAIVNLDEYKVLKNPSNELIVWLKKFYEIGDYQNIMLISPGGYVSYEILEKSEYGANLQYDLLETKLSQALLQIKDAKDTVIVGPYLPVGSETSDLMMLYARSVYENGKLLGIIAMQFSMEKMNAITAQPSNFTETGEIYLVDRDNSLITPSKLGEHDLLVQKVETQNSNKCFNEQNKEKENYQELTSFVDFKGDIVVGAHYYLSGPDWCLISEVGQKEVFKQPKQGKIVVDILYTLLLASGLAFESFSLARHYQKKYQIQVKEMDENWYKNIKLNKIIHLGIIILTVLIGLVLLFGTDILLSFSFVVSVVYVELVILLFCFASYIKNMKVKLYFYWGSIILISLKVVDFVVQRINRSQLTEVFGFVILIITLVAIALLFYGFKALVVGGNDENRGN